MPTRNLIVIQGATGVGKTDFSISVAKRYGTSILSADSRQFYREMSIGTAVPSAEQLKAVRHYFIQDRSFLSPLNAGRYAEEALSCLEKLYQDNNVVTMVGGSGLYVNAVIYGMDDLPKDDSVRQELNDIPLKDLCEELKLRDLEYYNAVDLCNRQRVVRALEVCRITGKTYSSLRCGVKKNPLNMNVIQIAVDRPRQELYNRINQRVDLMIKSGLEKEARSLYEYRNSVVLNTVGYKELFSYFDGSISYDEAIRLIKQNSRHYAKRQMTWLRADKQITWFDASNQSEILNFIETKIKFDQD